MAYSLLERWKQWWRSDSQNDSQNAIQTEGLRAFQKVLLIRQQETPDDNEYIQKHLARVWKTSLDTCNLKHFQRACEDVSPGFSHNPSMELVFSQRCDSSDRYMELLRWYKHVVPQRQAQKAHSSNPDL